MFFFKFFFFTRYYSNVIYCYGKRKVDVWESWGTSPDTGDESANLTVILI